MPAVIPEMQLTRHARASPPFGPNEVLFARRDHRCEAWTSLGVVLARGASGNSRLAPTAPTGRANCHPAHTDPGSLVDIRLESSTSARFPLFSSRSASDPPRTAELCPMTAHGGHCCERLEETHQDDSARGPSRTTTTFPQFLPASCYVSRPRQLLFLTDEGEPGSPQLRALKTPIAQDPL